MTQPSHFEPVIGLEIHVQLKTRTKMFCGCPLSFGDPPNLHTCPVCLGLPGSLPVVNARAVEFGLMIAMALQCEIAPRSVFARKNYFYPDLPKGYQISQYDLPLCRNGQLEEVRIHRAHLEEDAAKLVHVGSSGRIHGSSRSVVDFNRGGTPLVEIVTEPDLHSPGRARAWLNLLRTTLRQLGVSDVNMEEGSLRCDANISVRPVGSTELGTKTELKNMNSFRFLERGIKAEIDRQIGVVSAGGRVVQETLHYDPAAGRLTPLRSKEEAHDYRYLPDPDLVPLEPSEELLAQVRDSLPELPAERAQRLQQEYGLTETRAAELAFRRDLGDYFERAAGCGNGGDGSPLAVELANWIPQLVERIGSDADPLQSRVKPEELASLARMVKAREVSRDAAREVLTTMVATGADPHTIVNEQGLASMASSEAGLLLEVVDKAISADPDAAARVRAGNQKAIGPLVAAVMRETRGRADGAEVTRLLRERLGG